MREGGRKKEREKREREEKGELRLKLRCNALESPGLSVSRTQV